MSNFNHREVMAAAPDAIAYLAGPDVSQSHQLARELATREVAMVYGFSDPRPNATDPETPVTAAAPEAIDNLAGENVSRLHPLAQGLTMREIAMGFGLAKRAQGSGEPNTTVEARGMTTSDFSQALIGGLLPLSVAAYHAQAEHLSFVSPVEVSDFKPTNIQAVDMDVDLEELSEGAEIKQFIATISGGAREVGLRSYGRILTLSRMAVINNEMVRIGQQFAAAGSSTSRLESRLVAATLESNPVLDDGAQAFGAEHSNVLSGEVFSAVALGKAMALLRKQPTPSGQRADLRARHLVVEPELELLARSVSKEVDSDIKVSVLSGLPDGRWFVLADPMVCPTVAVLRLPGRKQPLAALKPMERIDRDGVHIRVVADLGACLLRRVGIVRGG